MRGGGSLSPLLLFFLLPLLIVGERKEAWGYGTNWDDNPYLDRNPPQQPSPVGEIGCLDKEKDFYSISPRPYHILLSCHTSYYIGLMAVIKSVWMNTQNTSQVRVWVLVEKNDAEMAIPLVRKELSAFITDPEFVVFIEFDALLLPLKHFLSTTTDDHLFQQYEMDLESRRARNEEETPTLYEAISIVYNSYFSEDRQRRRNKRPLFENRGDAGGRKLLTVSGLETYGSSSSARAKRRFQLKKQKLAQPRTTSLSADIHNYLRYYLPLLFPASLGNLRPTIITYLDTDLVVLKDFSLLGKELEQNLGKEAQRIKGGQRKRVKKVPEEEKTVDIPGFPPEFRTRKVGRSHLRGLRERRERERAMMENAAIQEVDVEEEGTGLTEEVCAAFVKRDHPTLGKALSGLETSSFLRALSLLDGEATFNAGVMSVHIPCWEQRRITDEIHFWMKFRQMRHIYSHGSQPPLLLAFRPGGRPYHALNKEWNTEALWGSALEKNDPAILHWNGRFKPWDDSSLGERTKKTRPIWEQFAVVTELPDEFYEQKKPLLLQEKERELEEMRGTFDVRKVGKMGVVIVWGIVVLIAWMLFTLTTPSCKSELSPKPK